LAIREALAKADPAGVLVRNDLARTHRNIGEVHRQVGKLDEALAEWDRALAIQQALLRSPIPKGDGRVDLTGRSDPSAIVREDLGALEIARADLLRERGRLDESGVALRRGHDLFEDLVREHPDDPR